MSNTQHTFHASAVAAVNQALVALGEDRTMEELSTTSTDATSRKAAFIYESARQKVLRDHAWTFARREVPSGPPAAVAPPRAPFPFVYPMPVRMLRVLSCLDEAGHEVRWTLAPREIHCERPACRLIYAADVDDLDKWSPEAYRALVLRLAADLAKAVTGRINERQLQETAYQDQIEAAKLADARGVNSGYDAYGQNHYAAAMLGESRIPADPLRR